MSSTSSYRMDLKFEETTPIEEGPFLCIVSMATDVTDRNEFVYSVQISSATSKMTGVLFVPWVEAAEYLRDKWTQHLQKCESEGKDRLHARREFLHVCALGDLEADGHAYLREILGTTVGPRQEQMYRRHLLVELGYERKMCFGEVWTPTEPTADVVLRDYAKQQAAAPSVEHDGERMFSYPFQFWWTITFKYPPRQEWEVDCTAQQLGHSLVQGVAMVHIREAYGVLTRLNFTVELDGGRLIHLQGEMDSNRSGGFFVEGPEFKTRSGELKRYHKIEHINS